MNWSANDTRYLKAGDKSGIFRALNWVKFFVISWLMLLIGLTINAVAQDSSWSFAEHPKPIYTDLSEEEANQISQAYALRPLAVQCARVVEIEYQIYQNHYPDYAIGSDAKSALLNWKTYAVSLEENALGTCVYFLSVVELAPFLDADFEPALNYCGKYSRLPQTDAEHAVVKQFDQYEMLVMAGGWSGAAIMLSLNNMETRVMLNNDVHYYFSLLLEPFLEDDELIPELVNLSPVISDNRKVFVENAATNLDLQSVLDTTEPCAPKT